MAQLPASEPLRHQPESRPVASTPWLNRFNAWRLEARVPTLTENATYSAGDYDHAVYMVKNDLVTHYETPGTPFYTAAGDTAARNSNIYVSSSTATTDVQAIDWWMQAPFHAMGMLDPRLAQTGFGSYREVKSGWNMGAAVDVLSGNPFTGGAFPVRFPGDGTTEPLTSYGGGEFPDPLQGCPGYSVPTGLPAFIELGTNVATTVTAHSFTGNGTALAHCVIDTHNTALGSDLIDRGGVILIPQKPLQSGVKYVVSMTVNGTAYTWSFNVGPLATVPPVVSGLTPATGPWTGGTPVKISGTAFDQGVSSVMFGNAPATSFTVVDSTTITATSAAHSTGPVDVTVTTAGGTSATSAADVYTYAPPDCSAAAVTSSKTSPQPAGTAITFTASATGARCTSPVYEFWLWSAAGGWALRQAYSSTATLALDTSGMLPGTYSVDVWVEESGSIQGAGAYETFALEAWTVGGCDFASMTPNPAPSSGIVTFTATAGGTGCNQPQYRFWLWSASSGYVMKQDFSSTNTWSTDSAALAAGTYSIVVHVKQKGSPLAYETWALSALPKGACGAPSTSATNASPQSVGGIVHLSAAAPGCTAPLYRYYYYPAPGNQYGLLRDWSSTASFDWNTAGMSPGTYSIVVHVKQSSSNAAYDTYALMAYTLAWIPAVNLNANLSSPQAAGSGVTLTAAATGTPQYQFWVYAPGGPWTMVQDYSSTATLSWNTAGLTQGTYSWVVYARQQGSGAQYDVYALINYTIT